MNTLSWIFYVADVVRGISLFLLLGSTGLLLLCCFVAVVSITEYNRDNPYKPDTKSFKDWEMSRPFWAARRKSLKWQVPLALTGLLLVTLIPNKTTIYAIAASELGEQVMQTETVGKAQQALDAWLDKQLEAEGKTKP